ncbi:MAG: PAS domain S-box protein [Phototrophicaceae bacterium]
MTDITKPNMSILIHTANNAMIEDALRTLNTVIIAAKTSETLVEDALASSARLVIIDDVALCRSIRKYLIIPIMLIHDDIDAAILAGADDCVRAHANLIRLRVQLMLAPYRYDEITSDLVDNLDNTISQELESILDSVADIIVIANKDGSYKHHTLDDDRLISDAKQDTYVSVKSYAIPTAIAMQVSSMVQLALKVNSLQEKEYTLLQNNETLSYKITVSPMSLTDCLVVIKDISQKRRIESILKRSEKNYQRLFENATDAIFTIDVMSGKILQANPQASLMLGYSNHELLLMEIDAIESDTIEIQDIQHSIDDLNNTDKLIVETQYKHRSGYLIDVEISSRVILQNKQLILISFVRDISEHKQALNEAQQQRNLAQALLTTANAMNEAPELDTVLDTILRNVAQIIPCDSANIMQIIDRNTHIMKHQGYDKGGFKDEVIADIVLPLDQASNLDWIVTHKKPLRVDDTQDSPHFNWVDTTTSMYINSLLTAPIIIDGVVQGFINLDSTAYRNFTVEQESQLMAFANQAAIAIQRANMITELQQYTDTLEKRVSERTEELLAANADLEHIQDQMAQERNLLRLIIDTIPDAIYVKDIEQRFIIANRATYENMSGITQEDDLLGKTDVELYPEVGQHLLSEEREIIRSGQAQLSKSVVYHNADGSIAHLLVSKVPLKDATGTITGLIGVNHDMTQLRQAEARLEQVINSARCLLWSAIVTQDTSKTDAFVWEYRIVNEEAAAGFLPLYQEDMPYKDAWINAISENNKADRMMLFIDAIQNNKKHYRTEYPLDLPNKTHYWLNEDVLIEVVDEGIWNIIGVCTDITMRKLIEEQLQDINNLLELRVASRTLELSQVNEDLVSQIAEREKAQASERQQRMIADALRDGIAKLATTTELEDMFDHLLSLMQSVIPHDAATIMLIEGEAVIINHALGFDTPTLGLQFQITNMPDIQYVQATKQVHIINDKDQYQHWQEQNATLWVKSVMAIPIIIDNHVAGIINLYSKERNHFSDQQVEWLFSFGEQVGLAILNARYTTELEKMVNQRTSELQFEQGQLKAILNGVTDGVIYSDMKRRPQYINQALTDITGFSEDEWLDGQAQSQINALDISEFDGMWRRIITWLETNTVWTGETELTRKDGSTFDAGLARTTVKNQLGETVGVVTVVRDISDEKRLAEQKARFITKAAHELRTPIANLKTRLFLMKRRPDKFDEHMAIAESVVNLMQNLVEHMFDLSRFERGMMEMTFEAFNLQDFLQEVIQYQAPHAERLNVVLKLELPEQSIIIDADPYRLTQVITNLIGNALKHTRHDSNVIIQVASDDDRVLIDVIDHGAGIAKEHLEKLFQPFYQASDDQTGVGLGLAIVQEIVKAHGGDISVESEIDTGTTFHIQLPLVQKTPDA